MCLFFLSFHFARGFHCSTFVTMHVLYWPFFNIKCATLKTLFLPHSFDSTIVSRWTLSSASSQAFFNFTQCQDVTFECSIQFQFRFFFFHLMSSSLDDVVFFLSSLIIESEEAGVQVGERLYSQPSEHPSACVDKKDECSESVQGQSERWEESVDLLMEQRWQRIYSTLRTKTLCSDLYFFFLTLFTPGLCSLPSSSNVAFFPSLFVHA